MAEWPSGDDRRRDPIILVGMLPDAAQPLNAHVLVMTMAASTMLGTIAPTAMSSKG